ncbi:MAG: hypothetical protein AB1752_06980, partial [Candidatus Zixiibacteriota bacterium]
PLPFLKLSTLLTRDRFNPALSSDFCNMTDTVTLAFATQPSPKPPPLNSPRLDKGLLGIVK